MYPRIKESLLRRRAVRHTRAASYLIRRSLEFFAFAKNRDDSLLFSASPRDLFHRHSEPQAKNPVKHTFQDWILHFASAQFRMTTGRDSLKKIATSAFRLLAMTGKALSFLAQCRASKKQRQSSLVRRKSERQAIFELNRKRRLCASRHDAGAEIP